ncbi:MAG: hypothetical protein JWR34_5087 [Mycobacterium sp.]|nr:hypothetical protein [Mycobacterium sp.]
MQRQGLTAPHSSTGHQDQRVLLEQISGGVSIQVPVDEKGRTPSHTPRWLIDRQFDPDDYSAAPSRVVARIEN